MIRLTSREQSYIKEVVRSGGGARLPYSNGERSSIVAKAKQLGAERGGEPCYGEGLRNATFFANKLCKELRRINLRWTP